MEKMREFLILLKHRDWDGLFHASTDSGVVQLFRYCFIGGLSFLIDFGCYFSLLTVNVYYLLSGIIAFTVSFAFNFTVSRLWIFHHQTGDSFRAEITSVAAIALCGLGLTELLLWLGVDVAGLNKLLAKIFASLLVLLWNFWARKKFVYHT